MKKLFMMVTGVALALSAAALDYAGMRIPDSFKPVKVTEESDNTVSMPIPGGGALKVQNETGGSVSPIPVRVMDALGAVVDVLPKGMSLAAEVSGNTWFSCAYEEMEMDGAKLLFLEGPVFVKGFCFVLYLRVPAERGLDAAVRGMLRQITLLPPDDGNDEPAAPLVKMDAAKVPAVEEMPEWLELVKPFSREAKKTKDRRRTEETCAESEKEPQKEDMSSLSALPAVRKAGSIALSEPIVDEELLGGQSRRMSISFFRELMRELIGPMSDEANAKFEAKWAEAMDMPSANVQAWIEKVTPIVSKLVRTKAALAATMVEYDETVVEARTANEFGSPDQAHEIMAQLAAVIGEMDAIRKQMKELEKLLDALGAMPDPKEEAKKASSASAEARKVIAELAGGTGRRNAPAAVAAPEEKKVYWLLARTVCFDGNEEMWDNSRYLTRETSVGFPWTRQYKDQGFLKTFQWFNGTRFEETTGKGTRSLRFGTSRLDCEETYLLTACKKRMVNGRTSAYDSREVDGFVHAFHAQWKVPRIVEPGETISITVSGGCKAGKPKAKITSPKFRVSLQGSGLDRGSSSQGSQEGSLDKGALSLSAKMRGPLIPDMCEYSKQSAFLCLVFRDIPRVSHKNGKIETDGRFARAYTGDGCQVTFWYEPKELTAEEAAEMLSHEAGQVPAPVVAVDMEVPPAATPEEKAERVAQHRANIKACQANIAAWQKELEREKDSDRRSALNFRIVCAQSDIVYEQDRIRAEETGVFKTTRTPFDEMCQVQARENSLRQIEEWERNKRIRNRAIELSNRLPPGEKASAERMVEELMDSGFSDIAKWEKLGDAMEKKYLGRLEYKQAMAMSDVADWEERIATAQKLKTGCDIVLALSSMGVGAAAAGTAKGIMYAYQAGTGYIEDGAYGAAKNVITTYSDMIDVGWSVYDGYKEGGWTGALLSGGFSAGMNYGLPLLTSKVNWSAEISFRKGTKPDVKGAKVSVKTADTKAYEVELKKADADISDFVAKRNKLSELKRSGKATPAQVLQAEDALARSVAQVNANPVAKNKMKYDPAYKKVGAEYDANLQKMKTEAEVELVTEMAEKGYSAQKFSEFRNASSKGTVGMDTDLGVVESPDMPFTKNGKRISKYSYQQECQKTFDTIWQRKYGQSAQKSWMNTTTSVHAEAYRNPELLKYSKDLDNMDEILKNMSRSDLKQAFDVTGYKADEMMKLAKEGKLPRLVAVQEEARGTAKDMKSKVLPMLESRIKALRTKAAELTKSGKALSKTDAHNLQRYEAALKNYTGKMDALEKIGNNQTHYTDWDDAMRSVTGGQGITEFCKDMSDFMSSIK